MASNACKAISVLLSAIVSSALTLPALALDKTSSAPNAVSGSSSEKSTERFKAMALRGGTAKTQGLYREAEKYLTEALEFGRQQNVSNKVRLVPMNDLAGTYRHLGKLNEAVSSYKEVLELLEEMDPRLSDGGSVAAAQPKGASSRPSKLTGGISKSVDLDSMESVAYATVLDNLAQVYAMQGDLAQCEKMQKRAIAIYARSTQPRAKEEKAVAIANLAQTYIEEKKWAEAESTFKEALAILEALSPDSPQVAILYDNYSLLYRKQGKMKEALALQEKALNLLEKGLGKAHPEVAIALSNIAITYESLERTAEAEQSLKRCLEINEKVFGLSAKPTTATLQKLIEFLKRHGRANEAKPYEASLRQAGGSIAVPHKP